VAAASTDLRTIVAYELVKNVGREWVAYEHTIMDGILVSSVVVVQDIPAIAKRKLELKLFIS